ncbi:hypothetical protein ABT124_49045 [Streptomyces sp. NPDC001982]|uniref:hypothetical protein n=1 Tax=Streptomyces sp. NPDC001982 TaxID=3154405 RepID=UPI0033202CF2
MGTGPAAPAAASQSPDQARLLPIERAAVDDQDHDDPRARAAGDRSPDAGSWATGGSNGPAPDVAASGAGPVG